MSDPYWFSFPVDEKYYNTYGPRSLIHSYATDTDDSTEQPRWGRVGKQRIVDDGPLPPFPDMSNIQNMHDLPFLKAKYDMTTFDEVLVSRPVISWTRRSATTSRSSSAQRHAHVGTFRRPSQAMQNSQTNTISRSRHGAVGRQRRALLKHIDDIGETNTHCHLHHGQRRRGVTWPDGAHADKNTRARRRRWLPRAGSHSMAGSDQTGSSREWDLLWP
jgi:arylsulfatase